MVARIGATTGKSYLINDTVNAVFASYLIRIQIKSSQLFAQYLYNFMQSPMYWAQIIESRAGIAQLGVSAKKLKEIEFSVPSVQEQKEIVRILDELLNKEQKAKEIAEDVLQQIDIIKKSILSRAFRGELGTNDPSEESAVELLKQVLSERQYGVLLVLQVKRVGISVGECLIKHSRLNGLQSDSKLIKTKLELF